MRRQEESVAKQEQLRRDTVEYELRRREEVDLKKLEAEMRAKAKVDRENQDLTLEQIKLRATEDRKTKLDSIM